MVKVRAKFRAEGYDANVVTLAAVVDHETPEDQRYHRLVPQGFVKLTIEHPDALLFFEKGKMFWVDFTSAEPPPAPKPKAKAKPEPEEEEEK